MGQRAEGRNLSKEQQNNNNDCAILVACVSEIVGHKSCPYSKSKFELAVFSPAKAPR